MEKQEFKDVWLPLTDWFYRVAYSILESEQDAEDAVQDLYIRLWNQRHSLDTVQSPQAYGTRVIKNICLDRLRSSGKRRTDVSSDSSDVKLSDSASAPSADRRMISREMLARLSEAMSRLPDNQRTVMEMKFFRQMDYDEIVRKTGISAINVRVLVSRARKTVVAAMKEYFTDFNI